MLRMELPASYAVQLLRRDVRPLLEKHGLPIPDQDSIQFVRGYGIAPDRELSDAQLLAACLGWIIANRALVRVPSEIVDQAASLASQVFDYPAAISAHHAKSRRGHKSSDVDQEEAVARIAKQIGAGALSRADGVQQLAKSLGQTDRHARRLLSAAGVPGKKAQN